MVLQNSSQKVYRLAAAAGATAGVVLAATFAFRAFSLPLLLASIG